MKYIPFRFRVGGELPVCLLGGFCAVSLFYNILLFNQNARLQRAYDHLYETFCETYTMQHSRLNRELLNSRQGRPWEKTDISREDLADDSR